MRKLFTILAASLAMIGSASAGTALMITENGVVIYDDARNSKNLKKYNNAAPLPRGYKRICNDNLNRYDYRNRDCVMLPRSYRHNEYRYNNRYNNGYGYGYNNGYPPPHSMGHRPPPGYRPPPGVSMGFGHRPPLSPGVQHRPHEGHHGHR